MVEPVSFWPLFDLVVRTPRLEMRLPREDEFDDLNVLIDAGIHDPTTMPFASPFTDVPPLRRARESAQFWWRQRADWIPDKWAYSAAVYVEGRVVGVQGMMADHFGALRSVETGSGWTGRSRAKGWARRCETGRPPPGLQGARSQVAHCGTFHDNAASRATSRSVGYVDNGETLPLRRGTADRILKARMD